MNISGISFSISYNVSKITDVPNFTLWASMKLIKWVVMWTGSLASLSQVSELMNMEAVQSFCEALESAADFGLGVEVGLLKVDDARGSLIWLWVEHADGLADFVSSRSTIWLR